jgi:hypothetical protein
MKIRHLVVKRGARGPLHDWQPSAELRAEGWKPLRLPDDPAQAAARAPRVLPPRGIRAGVILAGTAMTLVTALRFR